MIKLRMTDASANIKVKNVKPFQRNLRMHSENSEVAYAETKKYSVYKNKVHAS